ncbi:hypothetical protein WJX73_008210 [Symbiochloris irregularis]|uniref:Uncharacterized protein n=1 Tax=Symbiochloris irregularis TaxID=706552 RepID=A0AAW1PS40_9CHLO
MDEGIAAGCDSVPASHWECKLTGKAWADRLQLQGLQTDKSPATFCGTLRDRQPCHMDMQAISFVNQYTVPPRAQPQPAQPQPAQPQPQSSTTGMPGGDRTPSVQFGIYAALGFCVTMGLIIIVLSAYLLIKRLIVRHRRGRGNGHSLGEDVPPLVAPKDFVVVVQPGGHADVAYKMKSIDSTSSSDAASPECPKVALLRAAGKRCKSADAPSEHSDAAKWHSPASAASLPEPPC